MTGRAFRHRLEYLAFRSVRAVLSAAPESVALGLGSLLGWIVGSVLRFRRTIVAENLARAFPDRSEAWRRRIAARSYCHFGREAVAIFRLAGETAESLSARVEIRGIEAVERLHAEGRGPVIVTGHLGNWEIGGAAMAARGFPIDAVAFPQQNPLFDEDLVEARGRLGMTVVSRRDAHRAVLDSLAAGRVPAIVGDQKGGPRGLLIDFFGRPASTARGPAVFALRADAPIVVGVALALPGRPHRYVIHIEELPLERTGNVAEDVRRLTSHHVAALERRIRESPDQYLWHHRRWKLS